MRPTHFVILVFVSFRDQIVLLRTMLALMFCVGSFIIAVIIIVWACAQCLSSMLLIMYKCCVVCLQLDTSSITPCPDNGMLQMRKWVVTSVFESERAYLSILDILAQVQYIIPKQASLTCWRRYSISYVFIISLLIYLYSFIFTWLAEEEMFVTVIYKVFLWIYSYFNLERLITV